MNTSALTRDSIVVPAKGMAKAAAAVPILHCNRLCAYYGRIQVVFDVALSVGSAECVALLGPNGAGKTSLLGAIGGTVKGSGSTQLMGAECSEHAVHQRARDGLAYVPEARRNLFPSMSVRENLDIGLSLSQPSARAEILAFVHDLFPILATRESAQAQMLSGGEQQMLAIAVALGRAPRLLLLDEPSQGLAPAVFDILEAAFQRLRKRKIAVLVAEQNLAFAAQVADRYVVLSEGRIVASGDREGMGDQERIFAAFVGHSVAD